MRRNRLECDWQLGSRRSSSHAPILDYIYAAQSVLGKVSQRGSNHSRDTSCLLKVACTTDIVEEESATTIGGTSKSGPCFTGSMQACCGRGQTGSLSRYLLVLCSKTLSPK